MGQDENYNESCDNLVTCDSSLRSSPVTCPSRAENSVMTRSFTATPTARVRRSLSLRHHESKSSSSTPAPSVSMTSSVTTLTPSRTVSRYLNNWNVYEVMFYSSQFEIFYNLNGLNILSRGTFFLYKYFAKIPFLFFNNSLSFMVSIY